MDGAQLIRLVAQPLPAEFYSAPTVCVAKKLLGTLLCRRSRAGLVVGRIVETEAYLAENDSACHAAVGPNRKNASMFGPPGRAYVYTIHARQCVNIVTDAPGTGSAVLIRAVEPLLGFPLMEQRRRTTVARDLCRGPARLCEAFSIGREFDGWDLSIGRRLWLAQNKSTAANDAEDIAPVWMTTRIGVTSAEDLRLRFICEQQAWVSGPKWLNEQAQPESV